MKNALLLYAVLFAVVSGAAERLGLPDPVVPDPFGVNIHFVVPNEAEADALAAGGFKFVRMDFAWGGVEQKKGEYDFSGYDKLVEGMSRRGIRLLFILDYGNKLYDGGLSPHTGEGRAAFAKFAGAAAAHFAGKNILWEIWNEPNIFFWKPKPNVEDYAALALATIEAVRKADPDAFIQGPASSEFPWEFFEKLGERGVLQKLDAVSVHPYRQTEPETVIADYLRLRGLIDRFSPKKHIPIVSGEWGYSTLYPGIKGSDEKQAKYLVRQWLTNMLCGVGLSIWYDWRDDGTDPKEVEHHFGSVYRDMKPKPAYTAAQVLCNTLRGYRFVRRVALERDEDYALLFVKGEDAAMAMWTTGAARTHKLSVGKGAGLMSMLGAAPALFMNDGILPVALSDSPMYVTLKGGAEKMGAFWRPRETLMAIRADSEQNCIVDFENATKEALSGEAKVIAEGVALGSASIKAEPGKTSVPVPYTLERRDRATVRAEIVLITEKPKAEFRSPIWLHVVNAVSVVVLPPNGKSVPVKIENPSGEALELTLKAQSGERMGSAALKLKAGEREALVQIPLDKTPQVGMAVSVEGFDKDKLVASAGPVLWRALAVGESLRAELDGDAKISATAKAASAAPPEVAPGQDAANALEIAYRFDAGWRFLRVPAPEGLAVEGTPETLGMWVYGDGSGNSLRCRFTDKTGQTFQPNSGAMDWKGWRFVMFDLKAKDAGHWGGANDGVIHYPIKWDTLVLIDSTRHKMEGESKVYLTGFSVK